MSSSKHGIQLWEEVGTAITRVGSTKRVKSFSKEELVVMAIICLAHGRPVVVTKPIIRRWIRTNIHTTQITNFDDILHIYDMPLSGASRRAGAVDSSCTAFAVPPREGRVFLRRVLEPRREGPFRFLDLPTEIRVRVYEMLFSFPKIMVGVPQRSTGPATLSVMKREHQVGIDCEDRGAYIETAPMQSILAVLSVSKQIHLEAVPCFYQINHFKAKSTTRLTKWVAKVAPARLHYIRHLSFRYTPPGDHSRISKHRLKMALLALLELKQPKTLEIEAEDQLWFGRVVDEEADPSQLLHMDYLVTLASRAESFKVVGSSMRIKTYLETQRKIHRAGK